MIFHRVLRAVYKAAWCERQSPCNFNENLLRKAREFRVEAWWQSIRFLSSSRTRHAEGAQHSRRGRVRTSWEHPFTSALGIHWRAARDGCRDQREWMHGCDAFINRLCDQWRLPRLPTKSRIENDLPITVRLPMWVSLPPPTPTHPLDQHWGGMQARMWIQVDCRSVAELAAGRAVLQGDYHRPSFVRIARMLFSLAHCGWAPLRDELAFVLWSPREYNTVADHAVNASFDEGRSWEAGSRSDMQQAIRQHANLRICVDGGMRGNGTAAVGMVVYVARQDKDAQWQYEQIVRRGQLVGTASSAFGAETVALEWALEYLVKFLT